MFIFAFTKSPIYRLGYHKSIFTNDISLILDRKSHDWLHSVTCSSVCTLYIVVRVGSESPCPAELLSADLHSLFF